MALRRSKSRLTRTEDVPNIGTEIHSKLEAAAMQPEELPGKLILKTEFSFWFWHEADKKVVRYEHGDTIQVDEADLTFNGMNNLLGATQIAARREYSRLLKERNRVTEP